MNKYHATILEYLVSDNRIVYKVTYYDDNGTKAIFIVSESLIGERFTVIYPLMIVHTWGKHDTVLNEVLQFMLTFTEQPDYPHIYTNYLMGDTSSFIKILHQHEGQRILDEDRETIIEYYDDDDNGNEEQYYTIEYAISLYVDTLYDEADLISSLMLTEEEVIKLALN